MENGTPTYYLRSSVLGGQVDAEIKDNGSCQRGFVYVGGHMVAMQQNNVTGITAQTTHWVFQDPVTKSQRLTNSDGIVVSTVDLDPFGGETARSSSSAFQPHRYTTYERDSNGTDDAMHRRFDATASRFSQPDPHDGSYSLSDPQSLNRYAYVQNDPVNFTDPSGLEPSAGCSAENNFADCYGSGGGGGFWGGGWNFNDRGHPGRGIIDDAEYEHDYRNYPENGPFRFHSAFNFGSPFGGYFPQESLQSIQMERRFAGKPADLEAWNKCLRGATADQLGIAELLTGLALTPIPKRAVGLPVVGGASEFTNPVSYIGHKLFRGANLRFKVLGTNRLFGMAGRFVPYVGAAVAVYDVAQIIDKQAKCYEKATRKN